MGRHYSGLKRRASNWNRPGFQNEIRPVHTSYFQSVRDGRANAFHRGMNCWLIILGVKVVVLLFALLRERGEDPRFAGEELQYRS